MTDLAAAVAARFRTVNGDHPMTRADDEYVDRTFVPLAAVCQGRTETPDDVRAAMLADRLPIPGYLRSDGMEMVHADYFRLADEAGGVAALPAWFLAQWTDQEHAAEEWRSYLDGLYVCLYTVTPTHMQRKDWLSDRIQERIDQPQSGSTEWCTQLHELVDELDALTTEFTAYDRLRFGGPVSRDRLIDDVRANHPRTSTRQRSDR